jgi:hypothetical protein
MIVVIYSVLEISVIIMIFIENYYANKLVEVIHYSFVEK